MAGRTSLVVVESPTKVKAIQKYLDEMAAIDGEIDQASKQFTQVVTTAPLSKADRLEYAMTPAVFAAALARFGVVSSLMEK